MSKSVILAFIVSAMVGLTACAHHFGGGYVNVDEIYTARDFLIAKELEDNRYGLYSYLLFPSYPLPASKEKYKIAVRTYLSYSTVSASEIYLPKDQLNVFYMLLSKPPPKQIANCLFSQCVEPRDEDIEWIVKNYDYVRANIILRTLSRESSHGPYIVSTRCPVTLNKPMTNEKALIQDMTRTPSNLVEKWIRHFLKKATGEGSSFHRSLDELYLRLMEKMENFSEGVPQVLTVIDSFGTSQVGRTDVSAN